MERDHIQTIFNKEAFHTWLVPIFIASLFFTTTGLLHYLMELAVGDSPLPRWMGHLLLIPVFGIPATGIFFLGEFFLRSQGSVYPIRRLFQRRFPPEILPLSLLILPLSLFVISLEIEARIISWIPPDETYLQLVRTLEPGPGIPGFFAALLLIGIVAPISEELIFRGVLFDRRRSRRDFGRVLYTALIFGLFHANPWQLPIATIWGVVLGYLRVRTDSLLLPMGAHMATNTLAVAVMGSGLVAPRASIHPPLPLLFLALVLATGSLVTIERRLGRDPAGSQGGP